MATSAPLVLNQKSGVQDVSVHPLVLFNILDHFIDTMSPRTVFFAMSISECVNLPPGLLTKKRVNQLFSMY